MRGFHILWSALPVLALSTHVAAGPTAPVDPAHALAERFAHEGAASAATPAAPQAAPHSVKPPKVVVPAAATAQTAPSKPAIKTTEMQPAPLQPSTRPPLDYEMDMLRRARTEAAERKAEGEPLILKPATTTVAVPSAPPAKAADATPAPTTAPSAPVQVQSTIPVAQNTPAPAVTAPAAPASAAPAPAAALASPAPAVAPTSPPPAAAAPRVEAKADPAPAKPAAAVLPPDNSPRATLLVVLDPPHSQKPATAPDAVLCFGETCYLSLGFDTGATAMKKADVLKLKNTEEAKAGTCMSKNACVFRDVPIAKGAEAEIIDLANPSVKSHSANEITIDSTCEIEDGEIGCDKPVNALGQRIWVVPEALAQKAGEKALDHAIADGLPEFEESTTAGK